MRVHVPIGISRQGMQYAPGVLKQFTADVQKLDPHGQPKQLSGKRQHRLGNLVVTRVYEPQADGKTTRISQAVIKVNYPMPRNKTDASRLALQQVVSVIQKSHLRRDKVTEKDMYEAAMRGIVRELPDKYSYILPPTVAKQSNQMDHGQFVGIGVTFGLKNAKSKTKGKARAGFELIKVNRGGPANRAGLRKGDRIIAVNGKKAETLQECAKMLTGEADTTVKIRVRRDKTTRTITVTRKAFDPSPVETRLNEGIGYLKLRAFDYNSYKKVSAGLTKLTKQNGKPLAGLVFDLRNNPGGEVNNALDIADLFVGTGELASAKMFGGKPMMHALADPVHTPYANLPLTVLINKRSVSASELVSGILKDHKRAVIIGETSQGKGTVLSVMPLVDGSQLALTSAYYYLPNGETPHEKGITPNISVKQARANYLRHKDAKPGADYVLQEGFAQIQRGNATKLLVQSREARQAKVAAPKSE